MTQYDTKRQPEENLKGQARDWRLVPCDVHEIAMQVGRLRLQYDVDKQRKELVSSFNMFKHVTRHKVKLNRR
jgi:hypothetical protein